jgi:hypothetical protein
MIAGYSSKRREIPVGIGEICVRLPPIPTGSRALHPFYINLKSFGKKKTLFLPCPFRALTVELKQRVAAKLKVPHQHIRFTLCGTTLLDDELIPRDAFELTYKTPDSDDDIFRPRSIYY